MKNILKMFGIFIFIAIVGFAITGCDEIFGDPDDNNGGNGGGGGGSLDRKITIRNNTSISPSYLWIKPSNSTDWGSALISYSSITSGGSRVITLPQSLASHNVFDLMFSTSYNASSSVTVKTTASNAK